MFVFPRPLAALSGRERRWSFVAQVLAMACIVFASPTGAIAQVADLEGSRWRVIGLDEKQLGMAGDLHFDGDRADGATSCNFFSAATTFSDPNEVRFKVDRITRKGCSGEALELERRYIEVLGAVRGYELDGDSLKLRDENGRELALLSRKPIFDLEGSDLKIVSYLFDGGLHSVAPGSKPVVRFENGRFSGSTGCSTFEGSYALDGTEVSAKVESQSAGAEACAANMTKQDKAIVDAFAKVVKLERGRNVIRLLQAEKDWAVLWLALDEGR